MKIDIIHLNKQVEVIELGGRKYRFWVKQASESVYLRCNRHNSKQGSYVHPEYQSIRVVKEKPDDVYDPANRKARVNYAVRCIINNTHTRKSDACGEMGDGSEVFHEVLLRARKNARLLAAIKQDGNGHWFQSLVKMDNRDFPDSPAFPLESAA
jgi:hypothetical protein